MGGLTQYLGYLGLVALALCWVPQSIETIRAGRCGANGVFLMLSGVGSLCLGVYALLVGDSVFVALNTLTTLGAAMNIFYKYFPRIA